MRILIAEDDAVSRLILRRAVEQLGHECLAASTGNQAWEAFSSVEGIDVVISDWMMPGIDGVELCRRTRERAGGGYTYFMLLTALDDKEHFLAGMEAGADDYLRKPLDRDELAARLLAAGRVTSLHRELSAKNAQLERLNGALADSARIDPLTQLGNRLRLREDLEALKARADRRGPTFSAALCDVDRFKAYNDRYGHLAGDRVLAAVAAAIRSRCRSTDRAYRYGGEEFLVLLDGAQPADALAAAERVRAAVAAESLEHAGNPPFDTVTISIGVASPPPGEPTDCEAVLDHADQALYRAKQGGRNRVAADGAAAPTAADGTIEGTAA